MYKRWKQYPIKRSVQLKQETFADLLEAADSKGMKYGTLMRKIIEEWLERGDG